MIPYITWREDAEQRLTEIPAHTYDHQTASRLKMACEAFKKIQAENTKLSKVAEAALTYRNKVDYTGGDGTSYLRAEQDALDDALRTAGRLK